jgi:hypothetical protein
VPNAANYRSRNGRSGRHEKAELTLDDVAWLAEHSVIPRRAIKTLDRVVSEREEERSGAKPQAAIA